MDKPLLSIIVPVYNTAEYVRQCFDSLRNQQYENIEVLFVDDCSTDDSYEVCRELVKEDHHFRLLRTPRNGGTAQACNLALLQSKGELVAFMDSDDTVHPEMYASLYEIMCQTDADISCCIMNYVFGEGNERPACPIREDVEVVDTRKALYMLHRRDGISYSRCDKLYKKNIVDNQSIPDYFIEDQAVLSHYVSKARKVSLIRKPYYNYFQRLGSKSHCGFNVQHEYESFTIYCKETEYLMREWGFKDLNTVVRKGVHFLNHISLLPQMDEVTELKEKVMKKMREYDSLPVKSLGLGLYLKRCLLLYHYPLYSAGYRLFMKLFKKEKYRRITGEIIGL